MSGIEEVKFWRYSIPSTDGWEGWGIFILDSTGMFAAVTDYGNYAFRWPIQHTGVDDFRKFFPVSSSYLLSKVADTRFNGGKTEDRIRKHILEYRRDGSMTEEKSRKEWDLIDSNSMGNEVEFYEWYQETELYDASECAIYDYSVSAYAFAENLMPRLYEAIKKDLESECVTK